MARNSKHIIIHKPAYKQFMQVNFEEEIVEAYKLLSKSGLGLYLYLAKNKDSYDMDLSKADFCNKLEVSDTTYKNAKKELIEAGYLIPHTNQDGSISKDWYDFYTKPKTPEGEKGQKIALLNGAENCPIENEKGKKLPFKRAENCPQKGDFLSKEQIIDNVDRQDSIGYLFSGLRPSNQVSNTEVDSLAYEEPIAITEEQLSQVINKEEVSAGLWLINGKLFKLTANRYNSI